jgi:glycosyltransferase involved in cell wall biosynthesis
MVISVPLPPAEGIGNFVWNLSRFLIGRGHQVQVITRGERGKPSHEVVDGIPVWRPSFLPAYPLHVQYHRVFVQRLVQQLGSSVDLYHLHTPLPPPVQTRQPQLLTVHTSMKGGARAIRIRSLYSLLVRSQIPVSVRIERKLLNNARGIAVVASTVAQELGECGIDRGQVEVLGNGVDIDVFRSAEPDQEGSPATRYILAAGRLDLRKGFEDLIDAMPLVASRFPDVRLYIAGRGPLEQPLQHRIAQLGLDRDVQLLGHADRATMVRLYQGATLFAHAAHYEGLPTVLLEAMACKKAVVSTAVSGVPDVVEDAVNGLLVPARSPGALADAICQLLGDADLRARLGAAARCTVEARFSWQVVGAGYLRCYEILLDGDHDG